MNQRRKFSAAALLAAMAFVLAALSGTASATTLTSPAGTTYTSFINAEAGSTSLTGSFVKVECGKSLLQSVVWEHGAGVTARADVTQLTFSECNYEVTVWFTGSLRFHGTGNGNGTVTSTGMQLEVHTSVGRCVFSTLDTDIGTLTGGHWAKLDIASSKITRTGGSFLCGSSGTWNGSYTVFGPTPIYVD